VRVRARPEPPDAPTMPELPPPAPASSAGTRLPSSDDLPIAAEVSASKIAGAKRLAAPPRDVDRLLVRYGAQLPRYLDAQRWREIDDSHQRWPLLWAKGPARPGDPR